MYKIIGTDQKEYGPVTAEQLRQWLLGGRANAQTLAEAAEGSGWKPLGEFSEFADVLAARAAVVPPKPGGPVPTSILAIASFVLGLLGACGITAIVGAILGIVSLGKIRRSEGRLGGQGFAIAGIALSAVMLVFLIFFLTSVTPSALAKARDPAYTIYCISNLKQLCLANVLYAADHNGRLPDANAWCDLIQTNILGVQQAFLCPAGNKAARCHYTFNAKLSGVETEAIRKPDQTVMLFESQGGWNASGGLEQLLKHPRHLSGIDVGFVDGHTEFVTPTKLDKLVWEP